MRKYMLLLAAPMALISLTAPAQASEGGGEPFITAAHYKKNISLAEFRINIRSYFKSETAFRLIVRYVGDEIWKPDLSAAEFNALIRDDKQTRVRACKVGEKINTGAYLNGQFFWFVRACRPGEQIVQVLVNGVWKDMFSLNCLNAVEDQTTVPPPATGYVPPPPLPPHVVITTIVAPRTSEGSTVSAPYYGWTVAPNYRDGTTTIITTSKAGAKATNTNDSGNCCGTPPNAGH